MMRRTSQTVLREVNDNRWLRWLSILLFLIVLTWVVGQVGGFLLQYIDTFLLFFIAWILAFTLRPFAERLQTVIIPRRNRPLGWGGAVNVTYLGLLLALVLLGWLVMPPLVQQIQNLVAFLSNSQQVGEFQQWALKQLSGFGIKEQDVNNLITTLSSQALDFTKQALGFIQGFFGVIFNIIIILILSFIFLGDGRRIAEGLRGIVPMRYRDQARLLGSSMESSFGGFLRGQFLMGVIYGTVVWLVMSIFRLNFALLAAIVTTLFMLVPLIGYVAAYLPPVLIALIDSLSGNPSSLLGDKTWWVTLIIVVGVQAIIVNAVGPKMMSESLGVHPLVVFGAMLLGSKVGGVWGALFGIPVAGVINIMAGNFFNSFIKPSKWFNAEPTGWQVVESVEEQDRLDMGEDEEGSQSIVTISQPISANGVGMTRTSVITINDPTGDAIVSTTSFTSAAAIDSDGSSSETLVTTTADSSDEGVGPAPALAVGDNS